MKNNSRSFKLLMTALVFAMSAFVISCKDKNDDAISADVQASMNDESTQDAQQDEIDDMATGQLNVADNSGREAAGSDGRVVCAYITATFTGGAGDASKNSGSVTINFDKNADGSANASGCTDARGNVRKGMITVSWTGGRWFKAGSTQTIALTNYSINGVVITGARTWTNITSPNTPLIPTWTIAAAATSTWPDGTTATRVVAKTRAWDILAGKVMVSQTAGAAAAASGVNRGGTAYSMSITTALVYDIACALSSKVYIPVSGSKLFTFNLSSQATIDFGNGDCNNSFTVTFSGKTETFSALN